MSTQQGRGATFIREVSIRYRGARLKADRPLDHPLHAVRLAMKIVRDDAREHFVALYLDLPFLWLFPIVAIWVGLFGPLIVTYSRVVWYHLDQVVDPR